MLDFPIFSLIAKYCVSNKCLDLASLQGGDVVSLLRIILMALPSL